MMGRAPAATLPEVCRTVATTAATPTRLIFAVLLASACFGTVSGNGHRRRFWGAGPSFQPTGGREEYGQGVAFVPTFTEDIANITVARGRDAVLTCLVERLGGYRVGWVKFETKAIQAIHDHVITHNPRVSVSHVNHVTWNLHIKGIQKEDGGLYMCQINTDPMKSQIGVINVTVPPDFTVNKTSGDVMVSEGGVVKLSCEADGVPKPNISWRREDNSEIIFRDKGTPTNKLKVAVFHGKTIRLAKISRFDMGAYLCIATNGVPPSISKRIMVNVHFHPAIHVPNQLVGAPFGTDVILECLIEASPKSINYWVKSSGEMVVSSTKYDVKTNAKSTFQVQLTVGIRNLQKDDIGSYRCLAKNSLGEVESNIRLYEIPGPTRIYNMNSNNNDDEDDQVGSAENDRNDELSNSVIEHRGRPFLQMTMGPPRATYNTLSENHAPYDLAPSCAAVTAITAVAATLLALFLFVI